MRSIKIMGAFIVVMMSVSCKKSFLDRSPQSIISDAEYWHSVNDLKLYTNSFYATFPSYTGYGTIGIYGLDADNGSDNMISMSYNTWMNSELTPAGAGGWSWGTLRNINYFLANYKRVNDVWGNVKPYVGEALFFRSYFYFNMLKNFGDLPWINQPMGLSDTSLLYSKRLSRKVITDSIIANLDSAANYLSTKGSAQVGRVYKELALAFQSRVALYEGTWEKYHAGDAFGVTGSDGTAYLQKAAAAAQAVMSSGIFRTANTSTGATTGYSNLFNQTDYSGNPEIMFWRQYSVPLGIVHNWHRYTYLGAGRGLTKNLVDDYLCADGKPISVSPLYQGDDSLTTVVRNRDPRLNQTVYVNDGAHVMTNNQPGGAPNLYFAVPSFTEASENKPATGYQVYKGNNPDYNQQFAGNIGTTGLILFRYAEVLLNFAEAKAELGTITQSDVDNSINQLRDRVGMPRLTIAAITADPKWTFPLLSPLINEVRRERRVELACEGFRTDDILRWAAAGQLISGWKPKGAKLKQWQTVVSSTYLNTYPVDNNGYVELYQKVGAMSAGYKFNVQRDYLRPIPLSELQIPGNQITQNPGWQ